MQKSVLRILSLAVIGLSIYNAWAVTSSSSATRIIESVEAIRTLRPLPTVKFEDARVNPLTEISPLAEAIETDPALCATFDRLQKAIFGERVFILTSDKISGARLDSERRILYIGLGFANRVRKAAGTEAEDAIAFILAHEIGHYFQEAHAQINESGFGALGVLSYANTLIKRLPREAQNQSHGEVDAIGAYLMSLAGFNPQAAPGALKAMARAQEFGLPGRSQRETILRDFLKSTGGNNILEP